MKRHIRVKKASTLSHDPPYFTRETTIKVPKTRSLTQARLLSQKRQQSQDELEETD